jgi:hypothetical protein
MAKTDFENGTVVSPAFLDAINAHTHDGVDDDGHAAKINLASAAEVTGQLPIENLVATTIDQITASGNFTATFPTSKDMTVYYQKFQSGIVRMWWNVLLSIDSTTTPTASGTPVPEAIRPSGNIVLGPIIDGSYATLGDIRITSSGGLSFLYGSAVTSIGMKVIEYMGA